MNVEAAILARITNRARIILIGNPLPVIKHPLRMAEELATIDLISRGRLVTGWVRGAGSEQFFNNANPAYNREMFNEAHDFIVQAWTRPGPWRYEGKHFHYRHVNPWALPYQKPHPPMMIPGVLVARDRPLVRRARYPYIGLGTALGPTADMWDITPTRRPSTATRPARRTSATCMPTFVADTEEKAQELGKGFVFGGGQNAFSAPQYTLPPGYNSKAAIQRLAHTPGGTWLGVNREKLMQQAAGAPEAPDELRRGPPEAVGRLREGAEQLPADDRHARPGGHEAEGDAADHAARHVHLLRPPGQRRRRGPASQRRAAGQVRHAGDQGVRRRDGLTSPFEPRSAA